MFGRIRAKQSFGEQVWFITNKAEWWGVTTSGRLCIFYLYLSLETVFPAIKLIQNCYINMNIYFYLKWAV